jgi:3-oxoacid CoA-transferase
MGGAMDLVSCGSKVLVLMEHLAKGGKHKLLEKCNLPVTGEGIVNKIITEMVINIKKKYLEPFVKKIKAVFEVIDRELVLQEIAEEFTLADIKKNTGCEFKVANNLKKF